MCKKIIYICGKVSGEDQSAVAAKFNHAEAYLVSLGYDTVNPLKKIPAQTRTKEAQNICCHELIDCDGIFLIPDWVKSEDAKKELAIALDLDMLIINGFNK